MAWPSCEQVLGSADFLAHTETSRYVDEKQHGQNWFLVTAYAVMAGEQRFGSIVVLANITERKLAEETLRHTEKLAAQEGSPRRLRMKSITHWKPHQPDLPFPAYGDQQKSRTS